MSQHTSPYEQTDKLALDRALLALHVCPRDRTDLRPVALCEDTWGCENCRETWYLPKEGE